MRRLLNQLTHRPGPIALDIGLDSVKLLQLDTVGKAIHAVAAARWEIPLAAAADPAARRELVVQAVRDLLAGGSFRGRRVATCLRFDELVLRQVRMPNMPAADLEGAAQWEANERFGFVVKPELLHVEVAGEVHQSGEGRNEVLLIGAREETVEAHVALLAAMDLHPSWIDAEPACLFRSFERFLRRDADSATVTVLVEVGQSDTRVMISRGRQVKFLKWIEIGGRRLNRAVADQLHLDPSEAAQLRGRLMRQGSGGGPQAVEVVGGREVYDAMYDAVRPVLEELARELNLCLRYCAVTFRGGRAEAMTLLGGQAYDPCLRELIAESTNLPCVAGNPLQGVDLSRVNLGSDPRGPMSEWAVAAGLALRGLMEPAHRQEQAHEHSRLPA